MPPPAPRLAQHPRVASAFLPPRSRHMSPSTGPQLLQGWRLFRSEGREGSPKGPPPTSRKMPRKPTGTGLTPAPLPSPAWEAGLEERWGAGSRAREVETLTQDLKSALGSQGSEVCRQALKTLLIPK